MEFYFVKLRTNNTSQVITDPKNKSRYICFKSLKQANKYKQFLSKHKQKFGSWPNIDLTEHFIEVKEYKTTNKSIKYYESLFDVVTRTQRDLDVMSIKNGISYFYCHEFNYEDLLSIKFSGQDLDGVMDEFEYINKLKDMY